MRILDLTILWLGVPTVAYAQSFGSEPACAITCLTAASAGAYCAATDQACQCRATVSNAILLGVAECVNAQCSPADAASVSSAWADYCAAYSSMDSDWGTMTETITLTSTGCATTTITSVGNVLSTTANLAASTARSSSSSLVTVHSTSQTSQAPSATESVEASRTGSEISAYLSSVLSLEHSPPTTTRTPASTSSLITSSISSSSSSSASSLGAAPPANGASRRGGFSLITGAVLLFIILVAGASLH